jgi:hypothetical protein
MLKRIIILFIVSPSFGFVKRISSSVCIRTLNLATVHSAIGNDDNQSKQAVHILEADKLPEELETLFELYHQSSNVTLLASLGGNRESLEKVYESKGDGNCVRAFRESQVNLGDKNTQEALKLLWKNELLLVQDRMHLDMIFAFNDSFVENCRSHVRRIENQRDPAINDSILLDFLTEQNIRNKTLSHFLRRPDQSFESTLLILKEFSLWFKEEFPYYYNKCFNCSEAGTFLGICSSSDFERSFKSNVTEMYCCPKCLNVYRFPRFNNMLKVLETRRGRCGEYSILFQRMLRLLGYQTRWIADWTGHVWVEALISSPRTLESCGGLDQWIHVDPCEAAINEPLIYQGWGKNLTYIVAISDPFLDVETFEIASRRLRRSTPPLPLPRLYRGIKAYSMRSLLSTDGFKYSHLEEKFSRSPILMDVTASYTTQLEVVFARRDLTLPESEAVIEKIMTDLERKYGK